MAETCLQTLALPALTAQDLSSSASQLYVERLAPSHENPNTLVAGCSDGTLRLFDVRSNQPPTVLYRAPPKCSSLLGLSLEPHGAAGGSTLTVGPNKCLDMGVA